MINSKLYKHEIWTLVAYTSSEGSDEFARLVQKLCVINTDKRSGTSIEYGIGKFRRF